MQTNICSPLSRSLSSLSRTHTNITTSIQTNTHTHKLKTRKKTNTHQQIPFCSNPILSRQRQSLYRSIKQIKSQLWKSPAKAISVKPPSSGAGVLVLEIRKVGARRRQTKACKYMPTQAILCSPSTAFSSQTIHGCQTRKTWFQYQSRQHFVKNVG